MVSLLVYGFIHGFVITLVTAVYFVFTFVLGSRGLHLFHCQLVQRIREEIQLKICQAWIRFHFVLLEQVPEEPKEGTSLGLFFSIPVAP